MPFMLVYALNDLNSRRDKSMSAAFGDQDNWKGKIRFSIFGAEVEAEASRKAVDRALTLLAVGVFTCLMAMAAGLAAGAGTRGQLGTNNAPE
jgi:hypothetical protein